MTAPEAVGSLMGLLSLGAVDIARALRGGEVSSTEVVLALLERIDDVDPRVRAIRRVLADDALRAAALADGRRAGGVSIGPLDGVPFTVKENVDVAGTATTQGVPALADAIAIADAPAVSHLRRAGGIPIARTNLPDFALRWHTDSGIAGPTLNPWNPELTPGGSSGGEAVALATGMTPLGVGNDLGGSLRWPAQCNGIAALRPTLGRIPHALSLEPTTKPPSLQLIEVQGPMARRIEDLRLAFSIMCAPDPRDPWHVPLPPDHAPASARRVRVVDELPGLHIDPSVRTAIGRAAHALQDAGYELTGASGPSFEDVAALWPHIMSADARRLWPDMAPLASADATRFMDAVLALTDRQDIDAFANALTDRQRLGRTWSEFQQHTPLVVAPISTDLPFAPGADLDGVDAARHIVESLRATLAVNVLGLPSVAVPVGIIDGLPQAVQIIGPRYGESLCLDAAEAVEATSKVATPITPRTHDA